MTETAEMIDPMTGEIIDQKELAEALLEQAREQGVSLLGPGGLLPNYLPSTGIFAGQRASPLQGTLVASPSLILMKQTQRHGEPNEGKVSRRFRLVAWCG